jgi:hypothetical protein
MAVFFMVQTRTIQKQAKQSRGWSLASVALQDAYTDFILSRQAMNCTPVTMSFYRFTAVHDHTRAIRTLLRFWQSENYIPAPVHFDMPKLAKKRLLKLSAEQLQTIIKACHIRDRAVVLFMADSGLPALRPSN